MGRPREDGDGRRPRSCGWRAGGAASIATPMRPSPSLAQSGTLRGREGDLDGDDAAAVHPPRVEKGAEFRPPEGDREVSIHYGTGDRAGLAVDTGGRVERHDHTPGGVGSLDGRARSANGARRESRSPAVRPRRRPPRAAHATRSRRSPPLQPPRLPRPPPLPRPPRHPPGNGRTAGPIRAAPTPPQDDPRQSPR